MAVKDERDKAQDERGVDGTKKDVFTTEKNPSSKNDRKLDPQKSYHNKYHDGQPLKTEDDKYNEAKRVGNDDGQEAIKTARDKFAKNGDIPSGIASAASSNKTISKALNEVDGEKKSQVLKKMYEKFNSMQGILNLSKSGQQGSASDTGQGQTQEPTPAKEMSEGTKKVLIIALTGALEILTNNKKIGYKKVVLAFNDCLTSLSGDPGSTTSGFDQLSIDYQDVISQSLINLAIDYKDSGGKKLMNGILTIPPTPVIPKGSKPPPGLVNNPPLYSTQKFYSKEEDPYPGYIQWENIDGSYSYTKRGNSPAFETAEDAIAYNNQINLVDAFVKPISINSLKADYVIEVLDTAADNIDNQYAELLLGNTSGTPADSNGGNGGGGKDGKNDIAGMAQQLLPQFQQLLTKAQSNHLPKSVLDNGKVSKLLENFQKKKMENKKMAKLGDMAVEGNPSDFNSLFGGDIGKMMGVLSNAQSLVKIGGKTKGVGGLQSVVSSLSSGGGI